MVVKVVVSHCLPATGSHWLIPWEQWGGIIFSLYPQLHIECYFPGSVSGACRQYLIGGCFMIGRLLCYILFMVIPPTEICGNCYPQHLPHSAAIPTNVLLTTEIHIL